MVGVLVDNQWESSFPSCVSCCQSKFSVAIRFSAWRTPSRQRSWFPSPSHLASQFIQHLIFVVTILLFGRLLHHTQPPKHCLPRLSTSSLDLDESRHSQLGPPASYSRPHLSFSYLPQPQSPSPELAVMSSLACILHFSVTNISMVVVRPLPPCTTSSLFSLQ